MFAVVPFLSAMAVKVALLLMASTVAASCLARRSASEQHTLRVAALATSLIMPAAAIALPQWRVIDLAWLEVQVIASDLDASAADVALTAPMLTSFPVYVWLIGVGVLLLREISAQFSLARWARDASVLRSPQWRLALAELRQHMPRSRVIEVRESERIRSPCTWGAARPVLLLPLASKDWTEPECRLALMHELAHIHRLDAMSGAIVRLACIVHWYNPLVWMAAAEARQLQERACDDQVLLWGARASDYAHLLLSLSSAPRVAGAAAMSEPPLGARLHALFDEDVSRVPGNRPALGALIVSMSVCALAVASATTVVRAENAKSSDRIEFMAGTASHREVPGSETTGQIERSAESRAPTTIPVSAATLSSSVPPAPPIPLVPSVPVVPPIPDAPAVPVLPPP